MQFEYFLFTGNHKNTITVFNYVFTRQRVFSSSLDGLF